MKNEIVPSRYCVIAMATALALIAAAVVLDALIDPFGMYRGLVIEGVNASKPSVYRRVRLYKAFEVRRVQPQAIILGTSRSHLGMRCSHEVWARLPGPCYNLAFDGATTREMFAYLRHAHAVRPLRHVVLGLDLYHASFAPSFTRPDFDPHILLDARTPWWWRYLTGDLRLLASLDTLRASIETLRSQGWNELNWFAPDGQRLGEIFFRRPEESFMRNGPRAYFDEIDRLEVTFQTAAAAPRSRDAMAAPAARAPAAAESSIAYIRRIVEFCRAEGIDLRIFVTPSHVHQIEIAAATGGWNSIENGKRELVRVLAEDSTRHSDKPPIPLIDFSGYSSITTEALPPIGSRKEMRYYWDSSHFKEQVGDYVLERLFAAGTSSHAVPADFGVRLTEESIDIALLQQRAARVAYWERFPQEVAALQSMVRAQSTPKPVAHAISASVSAP
ncbi:MAG: hypothetical protein HY661_13165 [Betaproteobacteria bacterium]|nr:hypothetical protein [Betaproteobacteria bacterium]